MAAMTLQIVTFTWLILEDETVWWTYAHEQGEPREYGSLVLCILLLCMLLLMLV